jgi:hypothetical protein
MSTTGRVKRGMRKFSRCLCYQTVRPGTGWQIPQLSDPWEPASAGGPPLTALPHRRWQGPSSGPIARAVERGAECRVDRQRAGDAPEPLVLLDSLQRLAYLRDPLRGAIAQLGERLHGMQEVGGSIPPGSTILATEFSASPSSRGLGHCPFTAATGVRIPLGTPLDREPVHIAPRKHLGI